MFQTLVVYGLLIIFMEWCAVRYSNLKTDKMQLFNPYIIMIIMAFTIVFGIRYDVGVDYLSYLDLMINSQTNVENVESGWRYFMQFFPEHKLHFSLFFAFIALIQITCVIVATLSNRKLLPLFILMFFLSGTCMIFMNTMRQSLVMAIELMIIMRWSKMSFLLYALISLALSLIHVSALLLILIYPLLYKSEIQIKSNFLRVAIFTLCTIIGLTSDLFKQITESATLLSILLQTKYQVYSDNLDAGSDASIGLGVLLKYLINCVVISQQTYVTKYFENNGLKIWYRLYYIGVCLSALFPVSMLISRCLEYLTVFSVPVYSYFAYYILNGRLKRYGVRRVSGISTIISLALLFGYSTLIKPEGMRTYYHTFWEIPHLGYTYYNNEKHK